MNFANSHLEIEINEAQTALQRDGEELLDIDSVVGSLQEEIEAIHMHMAIQQEKRAQATTELWSSIDVHDQGVWAADFYAAMVARWLAAARTRPLAVSVMSSYPLTSQCSDSGQWMSGACFENWFWHSPGETREDNDIFN
ncbi:hypothetical protein EDD22DRAFT_852421 [Suillus occidentalis]|nr:hypothetical protein EDD22DRAFT_852421 [Suillus occidentalis]